ncbi:MAG: hypothetical protein HY912_24605 [Desulfomonile tiedjei]|uniref:Lipoprotein n=1 Tax=Desulfomonile tiedjei TaxID=2358 RepID=A0A9D6Z604_9BACT|nr:hypothetical protein [Desulfomonile tiedjei]
MTVRTILVMGFSTALLIGCIIPSQEALRNPGISDQSQVQGKPDKSGTNNGLIKPYIPSERAPVAPVNVVSDQQPVAAVLPERSAPASEVPERNEAAEAPVSTLPAAAGNDSTGAKDRKWEDQKVKAAATEFARGLRGIKKLKVCYAVKEDEWWVTLYEESGPAFELKQYTWNREQEKLEPFLVTKRVAADRLQSDLAEHGADMACEVLDPTPAAH